MIFDITVTLEDATVEATATNDIAVTVTLDDEVINPEETFCERVDECLDIPTDNGQYVLKILNGVISWEEFSASELVDGNGTTVNGNKVDLGGDIIQDTILAFNPDETVFGMGYNVGDTFGRYFAHGNIVGDGKIAAYFANQDWFRATSRNLSNPAKTVELASNANPTSGDAYVSAIIRDGENNGDADYGFFAYDNEGEKTANIYYAIVNGSDVTDISRVEANKNEVHCRHIIDPTGVVPNYNGFHAGDTYTQLEYNKTGEDDQATGTCWTLNEDGISHYKDGAILNQLDNSGFIYIGSESVDGSWRFATSSGNLVIQKRVSGSWVTKQTLI